MTFRVLVNRWRASGFDLLSIYSVRVCDGAKFTCGRSLVRLRVSSEFNLRIRPKVLSCDALVPVTQRGHSTAMALSYSGLYGW